MAIAYGAVELFGVDGAGKRIDELEKKLDRVLRELEALRKE